MSARLAVRGWRSARGLAPVDAGGREAPGDGATVENVRPRVTTFPGAGRLEWTPSLVGLIAYLFAITTFRLPIATAAMGLACLGLLFQRGRWLFPAMLWWFAAFLLWSLLGVMRSPVPELSWARLEDLAKVWLVTLVAVNAVRTWAQLRIVMLAYLAFFAVYPVRGTLVNYALDLTTYGRIAWNFTFNNANDLAAMTLLQLSMAVCLLRDERSRTVRAAAAAGVLVLPFVILVTQSRGAFIAASTFGIIVLLGHKRRLRAMATGAVLLGGLLAVAPDAALDRIGGLRSLVGSGGLAAADQEQSARQRWEIWKVAGAVVRDHPLFGVGVAAYPAVHAGYALSDRFDPIARGRRDTHSTVMNVLAESGWPGLVLFLGLVVSTLVGTERVRRSLRDAHPPEARRVLCLEAGLVAFLVAGIWGSFAHLTYTYVHMALTWAAVRMLATAAGESQTPPLVLHPTAYRRKTS